MRCRGTATAAEALALINAAERPLILAGHGVMLSGAEREILALAEKARIPIAVTLLGIGGVPASHPLNLGMMGMHGEAWVNTAIQEADLLHRARHAVRRSGDRQPADLRAEREEDPRRHRPRRAEQERPRRRGDRRGSPRRDREWLPRVAPGNARATWHAHIDELKGDSAVRDIQNLPDNGHLYAAHVINDLWRLTDGNAVVVTDVGQHQMWEAQYYKHDDAALARSPRAASARWVSRCPRRSAPRWRARTRKSGSSSATAASR